MASHGSGLPWRVPALVAALALSIGVIFALVWPRGDGAPRAFEGPAPPCPAGFFDQLGRAEALRAALGGTEEGRAILEALGPTEVRFCFGVVDVPVVQDERVLLLDRRQDDPELAARTGHLLHHVVRGAPMPDAIEPDADCGALVREALAREARAYALELRLRRALGVRGARYEFETPFFAAPAGEGEGVVLEYLLAHPDGGPGLDGLGAAYRQRCEVQRRAPR